MATVQKSTKINFYKFVATKDVSPSAKGADEGTVATVKALNKNTEALNNIGSVLNGIAKIAQDLKKVMLMQVDAQQKKNAVTFDAQYTKTKKEKKSGFVAGIVGKSVSFLEGLLTTFSNLFKLLVVIPALKWLSDPKNQETIATVLRTIRSVVTFIFDWAKFGITNTIDGLYNLLRDDASWWDRIVGLGQALAGIGAVVLGIRYLSNPLKLVKDITNGVRALVRFVLGGGGGGGKKPRGRFGGAMRLLGGAAIVGGSAYAISQMNQPEEKSQGGSVKILPSRSQGGWISGPQSGYKVSLDGGRSTSFIGHGTEYVARKANGGAFVVPFNTPGTKTQPHLTQKRLGEAKRLGYFANGGEITGNNEQKWSKVMGLGKAAGAKYPELVAAQFALESAWGTALSAKNNFFGIKATGNESATVSNTREVINGRSVYVDARFKNFSTPFDAINHLVTQWYKDYRGYTGVNNAPDAFAAASKLQKEGYATDPQYTKHLSRLMQQYSNLRGAQVTAPTQQPSGNPFMNFFGNLANSVLGIGGANAAEHGGNDNQGRAPEYTGGTADVVGISHPDTGAGYGIKDQKDQHGRPLAFSQPAAEQFSKALKASGMNLGAYIASTGRSDAKNNSVGGHPNSHHMYGEAIDMNGDGYEWMRKNGRKYGWQYVYNHGPGSAHFKYVGPGAGSTPKLGPPGSKPSLGPSVTGGSSSSTSTHSSGTREETKKKVTLADIMGGRSTRPVPLENYKTGNINSHGDARSIIDATEERNRARQRANEKSSQMVQAAIEAVRLSNTSNEQIIMQAQQGIQQAMQMGSGNSQPQVIPTGGGRGAVKSVVSSLASSINPLRGIFK